MPGAISDDAGLDDGPGAGGIGAWLEPTTTDGPNSEELPSGLVALAVNYVPG